MPPGVRARTLASMTASLRHLAVALALLALAAADAAAGTAREGREEVRVAGRCGVGATAELKLKADDGRLELEFEVDLGRAGVRWRVALVHERRVVWKGYATTSGSSGSFEVRRRLPDLPGADTASARAWGPGGISCRAAATLAAGD